MEEMILELVADLGASSYKEGVEWKGYKVYIPQYKGNPCIGLPYVVLQKGNEIRLSDDDECMEYLEYEQLKELGKKSTDELKQSQAKALDK